MEGLEGFNVIQVYRKITVRYNIVNQESEETTALTQREPDVKKNKNQAFNAILLLAAYVLGLTSIIIGTLHVNDCPAQDKLPTSVVVFGGLLIAIRLIKCVHDCRSVCNEHIKVEDETPECLLILEIIFILADAAAIIAMSLFVFSIKPTTNPDDHLLTNYCDHVLYNYSWYLSIVGLIIFGIPVLCACCG